MIMYLGSFADLRNFHAGLLLSVAALAGCAHNSLGLEIESKDLAARLGYPLCDVYAPLSKQEIFASARCMGIENMEHTTEWANVAAVITPGDQFRLVNCQNGRRVHGARGGYSFYGLFRGDKLALEFGQMIND